MPTDASIIRALESALVENPADHPVRIHLASLLLAGARPADALAHLEIVLSAEPDNAKAIRLAASAAWAIGDTTRAEAWRRLHEALVGSDPGRTDHASRGGAPMPPTNAIEERAGKWQGDEGVDWDAELRQLVSTERPVTLADVAGLEDVKRRLESAFLVPLRHSELRRKYGTSMRGGLLLWGPPGCGKTFLARAVAGELGAHFVSIGLHDVLDMWLGNSEKKLHAIFEAARRNKPSVLFFDEVDAIGHSRTNLRRSAGRNVVAQLLAELDGIEQDNDGVFVIGATNQLWDVDPALRRPGRFDHNMLVLPPDGPAREAVLRLHLRERPVAVESFSEVVEATEGFSGADLRLVCEEAAQRALAEAVGSGEVRAIGLEDLLVVARTIRPSTIAWMEMATNFATYANTMGEYDDLAAYLHPKKRRR
jgi:SpoVK/Ycf46/Vps4 family AAA+-type ATPase